MSADTQKVRAQLRLQWAISRASYGLTNYRHPERSKILAGVLNARERAPNTTTPLESVELWNAVAACEKIDGDMAEAGVYLGGTAAVMLTASPRKALHLFDTFCGLPSDENQFERGEYAGSAEQVRANLATWSDRITLHPGLFPASAAGLESLRFSFVHLDLDLYESTLAALDWFWPRLSSCGILLSHDYPLSAGVVRAFAEFFGNRPDPVIPLSGHQCLVVKR